MRKAESGFTLIELIVVIVILGILAVTAAAKFMNLSSDATASVVKGLAGALRSSSSMVYAKSRLHTGDYWVCVSDACTGSSANKSDPENKDLIGKDGWIRIEAMNGYPASNIPPFDLKSSGIDLINTIAGTVDLGGSVLGHKLGDGTEVGDWVVGLGKGGTMVFIPVSSHGDKDFESANYGATKGSASESAGGAGKSGQVGVESSDSCAVVYYNQGDPGTAPVVSALTGGC
ncbi:MAG: type II secretion system protein [Succinivibrionaceae bacterium]|jgi:prepilin-type N-terminal cleavage/methylation domain-containing protein|nr:type II secretion system protein [Succinivibrionaceae bacterium]MDY3145812.1 type II secretion system protein [Succinivibrionaceae bacterium]MDY6274508.1 type II secretion system protein [Succinivibrionaceae bacterium]MDY6336263.1 type II secretion system protein [Succinivibrionaceae bacterium]